MKKENKNIEVVIVFFTDNKFGSEINLRRSDFSFKIFFICFQSHQMPSLAYSLIWCFV